MADRPVPAEDPERMTYPLWICDHCGDHSECEPGDGCEVCCEGTIRVVDVLTLIDRLRTDDEMGPCIDAIQGRVAEAIEAHDTGRGDPEGEVEKALGWLRLAEDMLDRYGSRLTPIRVRTTLRDVRKAIAALDAARSAQPDKDVARESIKKMKGHAKRIGELNEQIHGSSGAAQPVQEEGRGVELERRIIDRAIEQIEAGFAAQWPSGRMPKHHEGWDEFAMALDTLRDSQRLRDEPHRADDVLAKLGSTDASS